MSNDKREDGELTTIPLEDAHIVLRAAEVDGTDELLGQVTITREDEAATVTVLLNHSELLELSEGLTKLVKLTDE